MTINNFMANVGGLFGLWLGPSIITLIKLIYVIASSCCSRDDDDDDDETSPQDAERGEAKSDIKTVYVADYIAAGKL